MRAWTIGVVAVALLLAGYARAAEFDHDHSLYDAVLREHVVDGWISYRMLKADRAGLDRYIAELGKVSRRTFESWSEPQQIAFLVNLYNAATLQLIVDHYPVKSIRDIGSVLRGPWDRRVVSLFGKRITLNNLEHDILRKDYDEPRLHMVLVCAAKGCPPLLGEAYAAVKLDDQMDAQTRTYLSSPAGLRLELEKNEIHLSAIFKWYGQDFVGKHAHALTKGSYSDAERGVLAFVAAYVDEARRDAINTGKLRIRYLDYDWSLNEAARPGD